MNLHSFTLTSAAVGNECVLTSNWPVLLRRIQTQNNLGIRARFAFVRDLVTTTLVTMTSQPNILSP